MVVAKRMLQCRAEVVIVDADEEGKEIIEGRDADASYRDLGWYRISRYPFFLGDVAKQPCDISANETWPFVVGWREYHGCLGGGGSVDYRLHPEPWTGPH